MSNLSFNQSPRRTLIGGYRVADVEVLLAQLRLLVVQLEDQLSLTRDRLEAADGDRRYLDERLEAIQRREAELAAEAAILAQTRLDAELEADARGREVVAAAEREAAAIVEDARRQARAARSELEELQRLRDLLSSVAAELTRHLAEPPTEPSAEAADELRDPRELDEPDEPRPTAPRVHVLDAGRAPVDEEAPLPGPRQELFDRRIEVDAGPFSDFASLSEFEHALEGLPRVEDVYIRRFEGERATIDVTLDEPGPLLDHIAERLPYRIDVHSADADRISLTLRAA